MLTSHPCVSRCLRVKHIKAYGVSFDGEAHHKHSYETCHWWSNGPFIAHLIFQKLIRITQIQLIQLTRGIQHSMLQISVCANESKCECEQGLWECGNLPSGYTHDDIIKWKLFPSYWPFVWGIHQSPVNSANKGQWCRTLMFSLICNWINSREAGDLRHHCTHYDVNVLRECLVW